jgi:uncharacterized phage infection (PIP) family protein YhgE
MNAASQLLRVLAIVGAIAAGVLFWLTNGKLDKLTSDLANARQADAADKQSASAGLADAQTQLAAAAASIKDISDKLKSAKDDASISDQRFSDLRDQLDSLQKAATDKDRQLADANSKIGDMQSQVDGIATIQKQVSDLQAQLDAANTTIATLQAAPPKAVASSDNSAATSTGSDNPAAVIVPKNLTKSAPAKILLVDTKNWLMALDVGSDAGVQKNSELYLKVGDENLAIVRILDTTATQSSAAIISTEDVMPDKFSSIATKGLEVGYQTEVQQ